VEVVVMGFYFHSEEVRRLRSRAPILAKEGMLFMPKNSIQSLLRAPWLFHVGALILTSVYWWSGLTKIVDFQGTLAEMEHFGLKPTILFALLTIVVQLACSALIISGSRLAWLGAGGLAIFTVATIPLAHRFWEMDGMVGFLEKALVQEHISVVGGLVLAAIVAEARRDVA
jgi:transmembrane protein